MSDFFRLCLIFSDFSDIFRQKFHEEVNQIGFTNYNIIGLQEWMDFMHLFENLHV